MTRTRAFRRHERQKALRRCEKRIGFFMFHKLGWVYRFYKNRKKCSCEGCRNVRRSNWANKEAKHTRQENLSEISFKEQLDELQ